jgi:hypothetical protein
MTNQHWGDFARNKERFLLLRSRCVCKEGHNGTDGHTPGKAFLGIPKIGTLFDRKASQALVKLLATAANCLKLAQRCIKD